MSNCEYRQLSDLTSQVSTYETLLRELYPGLDSLSAQRVDQLLGGPLDKVSCHLPKKIVHQLTFHYQQQQRSSSVSSASHTGFEFSGYPLATIDHTEEDFNRDEKVQAMGFVGEHSETAWLYRLKRDLDHESNTPVGENTTIDRPSISSVHYFRDDTEISIPDSSDLTTRPPQHLADKLVDDYFQAVHPAFPIIGKGVFLGQYRSLYSNPNVRPGKRWLAVLNLVFAIAAKHSSLAESQSLVDPGDHLVFFARAWRLSIGNVALLDHPNLQQVQVEGLAAFYLLATGQVNRCVLGHGLSKGLVWLTIIFFTDHGASSELQFGLQWRWASTCVAKPTASPICRKKRGIASGGHCSCWTRC